MYTRQSSYQEIIHNETEDFLVNCVQCVYGKNGQVWISRGVLVPLHVGGITSVDLAGVSTDIMCICTVQCTCMTFYKCKEWKRSDEICQNNIQYKQVV